MKPIDRLKEPSTWAGFAVLASLFGSHIPVESFQAIGGGVAALLAVFLPEGM